MVLYDSIIIEKDTLKTCWKETMLAVLHVKVLVH